MHVAAVLGYLAAVALGVLAIRRVDRRAPRSDRFTRLVDEDSDER